jgi:hypothetical protein
VRLKGLGQLTKIHSQALFLNENCLAKFAWITGFKMKFKCFVGNLLKYKTKHNSTVIY